jgi:hypothetical protein
MPQLLLCDFPQFDFILTRLHRPGVGLVLLKNRVLAPAVVQ